MLDVREDVTYLDFGCYLRKLSLYGDSRGTLTPLPLPDGEDYVYAYTSTTFAGQARDAGMWHVHRHQTDRFTCIGGKVTFAISDGFKSFKITLSADTPVMLYIPPNVYHCFKCYRPNAGVIINFPTIAYDPEDEGRVRFDELEAPRPW